MCGICGIYNPNYRSVDRNLLQSMNSTLTHRGPDGEGYFANGPVALAMRRLAIIDLQTGNQPIFNENRSIVVVFNGEIYNYRELRTRLEHKGHRFYTQSDTEVLVHGYEEWGDDLPRYLNGMFAFALWDGNRRRLLLARDHLGIKPLYYAFLPGGGLAFASELKALFPVERWSRAVDPLALDWFLATRYIPAPRTIYLGARKLPQAHRLVVGDGEPLRVECYWDFPFVPDESSDLQTWSERLRQTLASAVHRQMMAEVPLGAFLSGGIDSSIVVGLMAQMATKPVRTFSVAFPGWPGLDESVYARQVAERFGTAHTEITVEADVAQEWLALVRRLDEPFADPATLPTWLMARETRRYVTVVLTGEGADELFQGYGWYGWPRPLPLPTFLTRPLRRIAQEFLAGRRGRHRITAHLAHDFSTLYAESVLSSVTQAEERLRLYRPDWLARLTSMAPLSDLDELLHETADYPWSARMQALDLKVWLEGDPLVKADRATMMASLEARVPFLDVKVVELATRIPSRWHRRDGVSKWLLRRAFSDLLPPEISRRPKHAFEVPIGAWLRGPMRPYLEEALADGSPLWTVLRPEPVRTMAKSHWEGKRDFGRELWAFLHLAMWWKNVKG